jgi:hypothetical protein
MLRDGGLAHGERFGQLGNGGLAEGEPREDGAAGRVGESGEGSVEVRHKPTGYITS